MKAAITDGKGNVKLMDISEPQPGPYHCLCRIEACATCTGTDRAIVIGKMAWAKHPGILGHESVGTVIQCGAKVRHIKRGDRFLRPIATYPGTPLGIYEAALGGFAEYGLVTDTRSLLEDDPAAKINGFCQYQQFLPPEIPMTAADATMLITLKEIASYMRDAGIPFGSKVAILGTGAVSMAMCFFAKLRGAYPVMVVGRRDQPIDECRRAGADYGINLQKDKLRERVMRYTGSTGVNYVFDTTGDNGLIIESGTLLAKYGTLGTYASRTGLEPLELGKIGGRWKYFHGGPDESSAHQYLLDLVRMRAMPLNHFYSHVMPFDAFEQGFGMLTRKEASKVVFTMGG